jgi:hypothetical protein
VALGLAAVAVYVFDSIIGRPVDASTTSLIALVVGVISSVFSFNIGATSAQSATAQANQNTAAVAAAVGNGFAGPAALAHVGPAPTAAAAPATSGASSDNGGA